MWESEGSGGSAGAREDPERELAEGTGRGEPGGQRAALRPLRKQVLDALEALSLAAQRSSADARLSAEGQRLLADAERGLRAQVSELARDARWPGSVRDTRIVLRVIEVAQRELSALRTRAGDVQRAAGLLGELGVAMRGAFLTDREVGMD